MALSPFNEGIHGLSTVDAFGMIGGGYILFGTAWISFNQISKRLYRIRPKWPLSVRVRSVLVTVCANDSHFDRVEWNLCGSLCARCSPDGRNWFRNGLSICS